MSTKLKLDNSLAVVLHYRPFSNNSLIIDFFLQQHGRINALAKGVRKPARSCKKSSKMGDVRPFQLLAVSLNGKADFPALTGLESKQGISNLQGKALYCAFYLNELLQRLLPVQQDCSDIFDLYLETLAWLESTQNLEIPLRYFEHRLLMLLGYGINLDYPIDSDETIQPQSEYMLDLQSGAVCVNASSRTAFKIKGESLLALAELLPGQQDKFTPETAKETKYMLRAVLAGHLGERPLRSREMFQQLYGSGA